MRPIGTRAREFVEQLGAALAERGAPIERTTIRLKLDTKLRGEPSATVGDLVHEISKEVGMELSGSQPYLTLRENDTVLDVARIRELSAYAGIGPIPGSDPYRV